MVSFAEKLGGIDEGSIGIDAYVKCIKSRKNRYKTIYKLFSRTPERSSLQSIPPVPIEKTFGSKIYLFNEKSTYLTRKLVLLVFVSLCFSEGKTYGLKVKIPLKKTLLS